MWENLPVFIGAGVLVASIVIAAWWVEHEHRRGQKAASETYRELYDEFHKKQRKETKES